MIAYSDAEWTFLDRHPLQEGLGGILWKHGCKPRAAALDTPQHLVDALNIVRRTSYRLSSWQLRECSLLTVPVSEERL